MTKRGRCTGMKDGKRKYCEKHKTPPRASRKEEKKVSPKKVSPKKISPKKRNGSVKKSPGLKLRNMVKDLLYAYYKEEILLIIPEILAAGFPITVDIDDVYNLPKPVVRNGKLIIKVKITHLMITQVMDALMEDNDKYRHYIDSYYFGKFIGNQYELKYRIKDEKKNGKWQIVFSIRFNKSPSLF
jgi:hypothetical protein